MGGGRLEVAAVARVAGAQCTGGLNGGLERTLPGRRVGVPGLLPSLMAGRSSVKGPNRPCGMGHLPKWGGGLTETGWGQEG